jgi:hypothetical protein
MAKLMIGKKIISLFEKNPGTSATVSMMLLVIIIGNIFTRTSCGKPRNYRMINKSSIPYIFNPWKSSVGFKEGEVIGIVMPIEKSNLVDIRFKYFAKNCWVEPNREGFLHFSIDRNIPKDCYGKTCLVIGKVDKIDIHSPNHACDGTYGWIELTYSYIEPIR